MTTAYRTTTVCERCDDMKRELAAAQSALALSPADVVRHHRDRNLMPADYLLVTSSTAIVLYEAGLLDVRLFGMLADDVQADVRRHMRQGVEARRRVGA